MYVPNWEGGGKHWREVYTRIFAALILYQLVLVGIFGVYPKHAKIEERRGEERRRGRRRGERRRGEQEGHKAIVRGTKMTIEKIFDSSTDSSSLLERSSRPY